LSLKRDILVSNFNFKCNLYHYIMNLPNMERAEIDWREWSFLDSPKLPEVGLYKLNAVGP
jgi:hypothetical protein